MLNNRYPIITKLAVGITIPLVLTLVGCGTTDTESQPTSSGRSLSLNMPDSLTGGKATQAKAIQTKASQPQTVHVQRAAGGTGEPCAYRGSEDEDPFRNGYETTKFLLSAIATWTCVADTLIVIADAPEIPHDGEIHEAENNKDSSNYDPEDPTHYSVTDDSATQVTIRLYYGYNRFDPPVVSTDPQFYISWNEAEDGEIAGRMIIDGKGINKDKSGNNPEDPTWLRMDFDFTASQKNAEMFLRFDENNRWAEGFRILVNKDLTASPLAQVFTAKGFLDMKAQFVPVDSINDKPILKTIAVSDVLGEGASIAVFTDVSLPLELNAETGNHLGNYLFSKEDKYFFHANQSSAKPWDWINKSITKAEYRGGRTTPATGGTWIPFNPSLDLIEAFEGLDLGVGYFDTLCNNTDPDCTAMLQAVHDFTDGFADQEPNQGEDPQDWRSEGISNVTYMDSVYPNGANWDGAFDFVFTP